MNLSALEYVKIYHRNGTFNKHPSLAIFDEDLVRQTNQGLPVILSQFPLDMVLTVTLIWQLKKTLPKCQLKLQIYH